MIARLRGTLVERGVTTVVVECAGVGYEVHVSLATLAELGEAGSEVTLRVFTQATENKIALYGFATAEERDLFDRLITVKNVGPSTAMELLSASSSSTSGGADGALELARMIARGDLQGLTRMRGVGKKRADMLVVELREKCEQLLMTWGAAAGTAPARDLDVARRGARPPILDDVVSALVHLGCRPAEAEKVVQKIDAPPGATVETLLVEALRSMPRSLS